MLETHWHGINNAWNTYAENGSNFLKWQTPGIWECEPYHSRCQTARDDKAEVELPTDFPASHISTCGLRWSNHSFFGFFRDSQKRSRRDL